MLVWPVGLALLLCYLQCVCAAQAPAFGNRTEEQSTPCSWGFLPSRARCFICHADATCMPSQVLRQTQALKESLGLSDSQAAQLSREVAQLRTALAETQVAADTNQQQVCWQGGARQAQLGSAEHAACCHAALLHGRTLGLSAVLLPPAYTMHHALPA